jgi:hypothetical protein
MRGRKPEADPRFTPHGSWERAENDADSRRSFAVGDYFDSRTGNSLRTGPVGLF